MALGIALPLTLFVFGLIQRLSVAYRSDSLYGWEKSQILIHGIGTGVGLIALILVRSERTRLRKWPTPTAIGFAVLIAIVGCFLWLMEQYEIRY